MAEGHRDNHRAARASDIVQTDNEGRDCREATARGKKLGFRSRSIVKGGTGAFTRTLGLLGAIFAWGIENDRVTANPVRAYALCRCSEEGAADCNQYRLLADSLRVLECKRDRNDQPLHRLIGIAGIRFIAMSGVRKGECEHLRWDEVDANGTCIALEETKTGFSLRPLGRAAFATIDELDAISDFVFAAEADGAGYKGLPGLWRTVQKTARQLAAVAPADPGEVSQQPAALDGITLHSLRHSFAGIAEELGASMPTIAALLGHRLGGVTGGYILKRVDVLLVDAANRVGDHIAMLMRGEVPTAHIVQFQPRRRATEMRVATKRRKDAGTSRAE